MICGFPFVSQSDITDVNQIFKDLAVLVHEQGEVIGEGFVIVLLRIAMGPKIIFWTFWDFIFF